MTSLSYAKIGSQGCNRYTYERQDYVGLSNQGATCYMNSLLQTLFMTPDFRREIYKWRYDESKHGDPEDCIPLQLQILFGKLQLSDSMYIDTTALPKSFQWDVRQSFQQQDVQEFCRILFEAIEQSIDDTQQTHFIKGLFEGSYTDYVKCKVCEYESSREDNFQDISLTVRSDFEKVYNDSVEKALLYYIKPEELNESNQYFCSSCNSKQNATKGLKFKKLPQILVLQLKRFDLDYTTMQRVKLNDDVKFPVVLNMNSFVQGSLPHSEESDSDRNEFEMPLNSQQMKFYTDDVISPDLNKRTIPIDRIALKRQCGRTPNKKQERSKLINKYKKHGKNVYELYSVMVHSGSALGGHYYAYIWSFENESWYNFNDSSVREASESELEKLYGGNSRSFGYWSANSSANAYLLMYRKVGPVAKIEKEEVPAYVIEELNKAKEKEKQEQLERVEKLKHIKLRVFYNGVEAAIECKKDYTMEEFKLKAMEEFSLPLDNAENIRIRGYSSYFGIFQEVFDHSKTLDALGLYSIRIVGIEEKESSSEWQSYDPNKISVKLHVFDSSASSFEEMTQSPVIIEMDKRETVRQMMQIFKGKVGIPVDRQKIVRKSLTPLSPPEVLSSPGYLDHSLSYARISEGSVLFIEESTETSQWSQLLVQESRKFCLKFNHPDAPANPSGQVELKESVTIDSRVTIQELKTKISEKLSIPVDEFIMKKGSKYGSELKDLTMTVKDANFASGNSIYIERGVPIQPDETRLVFHLVLPPKDSDTDGTAFCFEEICELSVNIQTSVSQIKDILATELQVACENIRLREKFQEKLGRAFRNDEIIKNHYVYDKKNYAVQVLDYPDQELAENECYVVVRRLFPSCWELTAPRETVINKTWTVHQLGTSLAELLEISDEFIMIYKVSNTYTFGRGDLENEKFMRTFENSVNVSKSPLYLGNDGSLIIVKDASEEQRPMTEDEKLKYSNKHYQSWSYNPKGIKETGMKITVKKKAQDELGDN